MTPKLRICTIVLSVVTCFALINDIPSPRVSGSANVGVTTTLTSQPHVVVASPHWYSPIFALGPQAKDFFTCVLQRESRSTWTTPDTHDGDPAYPGQYGLFQFVWPSKNNAWDAYIFPVLHVEPRYASAYQQAEGAAILWRLGPGEVEHTWTVSDGCSV